MKPLIKDPFACIYVTCTYKNTLITITNSKNETLCQKSSRSYPSNKKRKNNPYILRTIILQISYFLKTLKYRHLAIIFNGIGIGRYNVLKHLTKHFKIFLIQDKTNTPFNGCRLKKLKRK